MSDTADRDAALRATGFLSDRVVIWLAIASAIVTANAYYIHPIVAPVADEFAIGAAQVGAVPALNQLALAFGILLLLPLGDRFSNRRMVLLCLSAQVAALALMALAQDFWLFLAGSTLLGFFTIAPYLLPAYVSKRVPPERLGHVTSILTTGVIAGVLLSRTGSGVIAEYLGWRSVYVLATALMLGAAVIVPLLMEKRTEAPSEDNAPIPYWQLLGSLFSLLRQYPQVLVSGVIQGLGFAIFLIVWLGLGLHLTGPEMGYGTDVVGYLAAASIINLVTTPRLGRWADRLGAYRARLLTVFGQLAGVLLLYPCGGSVWLLLVPLTLMNVFGPTVDVTGRMTVLALPAEIRTRMMTLYIVLMFLGGGFGSWSGTIAYDLLGWTGTSVLAATLSILILLIAYLAARRWGNLGAERNAV